jgi:large subunit ribosomal protein L1
MAHGKRYRQQYGKVQRNRAYPPAEAVSLIKETAAAKFDETVELHLLLGLNVRHAEEQLRGTLALPHGLGKDVTVAVFAQGQQARDAEAAGADFVGGDDLAEKVEEGWTDFDVAIATPQMMGTVGKLGRVLGPQGKMPNPKVGTVTDDIERAVSDSKAGKVEYRTDRQAIIHMTIGKASFDEPKLLDNYTAVIDEIVRARPSSAKGKYIRSATLTTTMGPGIKVDAGKAGDTSEPRSAGPVEESDSSSSEDAGEEPSSTPPAGEASEGAAEAAEDTAEEAAGEKPAAPGGEAEEGPADGPSEEQSQSDSPATSEGDAEEAATA